MTFPLNPSEGDTYKNWTWNGQKWVCGAGDGGGGGGGTFIGPNPPSGAQAGQLWFNTTDNRLYVYDGAAWIVTNAGAGSVAVGDTPPTNPGAGDFWFNTTNDWLYIWDGNAWVLSHQDALTTVGPTAPSPAIAGMLWHNTTDNVLYVFDGTNWIVAHPTTTVPGSNPPSNPTPGTLWWNTSTSEMYVWDGNSWVAVISTYPTPGGNVTYVQATPPDSPNVGDLWFNTTNSEMSIWSGTSWLPTGATPPGPIPGVIDGSDAPPGFVGEFLFATNNTATEGSTDWTGYVFVPWGSWQTVASLTLPAGDWDVWAALSSSLVNDNTINSGQPSVGDLGTTPNSYQVSLSPSTVANPVDDFVWWPRGWEIRISDYAIVWNSSVGPVRVSSATNTVMLLRINQYYDSRNSFYISARRMR